MSPIRKLVDRIGANRRWRETLGLGVSVLSVLMIASFVAKNAGITKADVARSFHLGNGLSVSAPVRNRHYYLHRIFEPNAGETEALPPVVSQGVNLARTHRLREVGLSPALWADVQLLMRFGDGLYPIRLDRTRTSEFVLFGADERPEPACELIGQLPQARLMKCR